MYNVRINVFLGKISETDVTYTYVCVCISRGVDLVVEEEAVEERSGCSVWISWSPR